MLLRRYQSSPQLWASASEAASTAPDPSTSARRIEERIVIGQSPEREKPRRPAHAPSGLPSRCRQRPRAERRRLVPVQACDRVRATIPERRRVAFMDPRLRAFARMTLPRAVMPSLSSPRKREGGFAFEVQQELAEALGWGCPVKAFSRGVVVGAEAVGEVVLGEGGEVGFAGQGFAHASDGVFDAAFLPGGVGVAEEGLDGEGVELVVAGELGSVVEGDGLAHGRGQRGEQLGDGFGDGACGLSGGLDGEEDAGGSLVQGEDGLAVAGEEDEVGLPVSWGGAVLRGGGAFGDGDAVLDVEGRAAASAAAASAFAFGAREVVAPGVVGVAVDLGLDEAVDGLGADQAAAMAASEGAADLLGRPAAGEAGEDAVAQGLLALEA